MRLSATLFGIAIVVLAASGAALGASLPQGVPQDVSQQASDALASTPDLLRGLASTASHDALLAEATAGDAAVQAASAASEPLQAATSKAQGAWAQGNDALCANCGLVAAKQMLAPVQPTTVELVARAEAPATGAIGKGLAQLDAAKHGETPDAALACATFVTTSHSLRDAVMGDVDVALRAGPVTLSPAGDLVRSVAPPRVAAIAGGMDGALEAMFSSGMPTPPSPFAILDSMTAAVFGMSQLVAHLVPGQPVQAC